MQKQAAIEKTGASPDSKSAATREKLLRAAEELFIERGYDGVSIRDVTDRAGATKGHIYYYFENKQALFDAVMDGYFRDQAVALMGAVGAGTSQAAGSTQKNGASGNGATDMAPWRSMEPADNTRDMLHAAVDAYLDFVDAHPGYPRLIQREACSKSANSEKIARNLEPIFNWGSRLMSGRLPADGPLSARHFFISFFGMAINFYTYSPLLERLWGGDPSAALAERREHLHHVLDAIIEKFFAAPEANRPLEKT